MSKLKIALQKKGRLNEKSIVLLKECGIQISNSSSKLKASARNFPIEVLFLRDDDIPQYVEQQVADIGIVGENEYLEKEREVDLTKRLGFSRCRLSLAIPRDIDYTGIGFFEGKKIATSYPNILKQYLDKKNITSEIEEISGSVEIAPSIGLANGICDIVSTGSTLLTNGLKEVEQILKSEALLIASKDLSNNKQQILKQLIFRIESVQNAKANKYILLNAPNDKLEIISTLLPGMKSPSIYPLANSNWSSLHSVVQEDDFWEIIDQLKSLGAQGILVLDIEKMIL
ncbi:UNVERIFIED_CONTAM: hypothetical protein GTU68_000108 [Idotea baltica]|nr:hypothetical protein [Idotea baltica]